MPEDQLGDVDFLDGVAADRDPLAVVVDRDALRPDVDLSRKGSNAAIFQTRAGLGRGRARTSIFVQPAPRETLSTAFTSTSSNIFSSAGE